MSLNLLQELVEPVNLESGERLRLLVTVSGGGSSKIDSHMNIKIIFGMSIFKFKCLVIRALDGHGNLNLAMLTQADSLRTHPCLYYFSLNNLLSEYFLITIMLGFF